MAYAVKEIFYSIQGEGARAGRCAVFCRFAGCNLWSGREADRAEAACNFCDTDFLGVTGPGGGQFASEELAEAISRCWAEGVQGEWPSTARPYVVFTGGEPLLQLDQPLVEAVARRGFETALETNGTRPLDFALDWVCVSPKAGVELVLREGDELKLVHPQEGAAPELYQDLPFRHFFLQPMDGPELARNQRLALDYCLAHPQWRISLQLHKILGLP